MEKYWEIIHIRMTHIFTIILSLTKLRYINQEHDKQPDIDFSWRW